MSTPPDKLALRSQYRQRRRELSDTQRQREQRSINQHLMHWVSKRKLRTIAAYWAADGEVALHSWMTQAQQSGCRILLPIIGESPGDMVFGLYEDDTHLLPNRYGIAEPTRKLKDANQQIDLILLPLVAFDKYGARLGMGGGYYDRFLAQTAAVRCGVAFECQRHIGALPQETWDARLNAVVTGSGVVEFESPA